MLSITLYEIAFSAADFEIEETTVDKIDPKELEIFVKMQTAMNKLMGTYDEFTRELNKLRSARQQFESWKNKKALIFILRKKENKSIAGYCIVINAFVKNVCHVSELYLDKKYRSGGLGKMFLMNVENIMKSKGYNAIRLFCLKNNEVGNRLYNSLGYGVTSRVYSKKL